MERQEANFKILTLLMAYIAKHPTERFQQALWNLELIRRDSLGEFIDDYYEESVDTLIHLNRILSEGHLIKETPETLKKIREENQHEVQKKMEMP